MTEGFNVLFQLAGGSEQADKCDFVLVSIAFACYFVNCTAGV